MTPAQLATFKAAILAEPALAAARTAGDHGAIVAFYNANGTGTIWRPFVSIAELNTAVVFSEFASLTALLQSTYMAITQGLSIDATKANIRNGFATIFGAPTASRANLLALCARVPTRFEQLFTTAQVTEVFGQMVTTADVADALR